MRTAKRFTPKVLERFIREGRGTGTHENYIPWHRVTRGDPSSLGRSHLMMWRNRLRELLSDGELEAQLFATMVPNLDDAVEQYRLDTDDAPHLLVNYGCGNPWKLFPGTLEIAAQLDIKHPMVRDGQSVRPWEPSSDLVLILNNAHGEHEALAIAFKPPAWNKRRRTVELLNLERHYWAAREVPWLLITPDLYDPRVGLTLRRTAPWALGEPTSIEERQVAMNVACRMAGFSVTSVLDRAAELLGSLETAQRALWQAVWSGELPVDLSRGWRPQIPLKFISDSAFRDLNPISSGRSAWN